MTDRRLGALGVEAALAGQTAAVGFLGVEVAVTGSPRAVGFVGVEAAVTAAAEPEPPQGAVRMPRYRRWVAAVLAPVGTPAPAGRARWASYGAGLTTPGAPSHDVIVYTEAQLQTAPRFRVPISLTRFAPGTPVPSYYRLISESVGELDI